MYAYARAGKEKYREIFLLYPATVAPVDSDFDQSGLMLRVRQFDPRKIYDPEIGALTSDSEFYEQRERFKDG